LLPTLLKPKHHFGIGETLSPSPERKHHFGFSISATPSHSAEKKHHFGIGIGIGIMPSCSPERKHHFGITLASPLPSPEPEHHSGIHTTPSPLALSKKKSNFGFQEPFFLPDPKDDFEEPVPLSPECQGFSESAPLSHQIPAPSQTEDAVQVISPLLHAEDFGILTTPHQGPSQTGTGTHRSTEVQKWLGSSSQERGKFHIITSYMYLTLVYVAWIWGKRAPPPTNNNQNDQPETVGQVNRMHELVCWVIHILV